MFGTKHTYGYLLAVNRPLKSSHISEVGRDGRMFLDSSLDKANGFLSRLSGDVEQVFFGNRHSMCVLLCVAARANELRGRTRAAYGKEGKRYSPITDQGA